MATLVHNRLPTVYNCQTWSKLIHSTAVSMQIKKHCQLITAISIHTTRQSESAAYIRSRTSSQVHTMLLPTSVNLLSPPLATALSSLRLLAPTPLLLCNRNFSTRNKKICTIDSSYREQSKNCCFNYVVSSHSHLQQPIQLLSACQRVQKRTQTRFISTTSKFFKQDSGGKVMEVPEGVFCGSVDRFNGVLVDSAKEYDEATDFEKKLQKSLDHWTSIKRRAIWFTLQKEHAAWVPHLAKAGFVFHHVDTTSTSLVMYRWLPTDEAANIPTFCHTMLGVGGLVVNDKDEVLVVSDRYALIANSWKLPGGYVEPGEEIVTAAIREVKEETGIDCEFRTVISIRHSHGGNFGSSDMYVVVALKPLNHEVRKCEREIARAQWMPVTEYLQHPDVHETNRHFMRTYLDYNKRNIRFAYERAQHRVLKREYTLYYMKPIEEKNEC
ncbi:uncharacterized protein LOC105219115 isoform X2 [Zeugodacus cucurbitae]|uniref:Nudix hydrolase 8 n=1 Tax=Zeugodacus cucurbitae TaxID=28588 RepID=A0A0A1X000_ZEUCU|nr:uncharacterized protein LOC105219115 isoform X2 [Zeugodacus cucurbitae]